MLNPEPFRRAVHQRIEVNQARTPTERFEALCDLLDFARAAAPKDEASRQRRLRANAFRRRHGTPSLKDWQGDCLIVHMINANDPRWAKLYEWVREAGLRN